MLPKSHSGDVSSIPWGVRETPISWANCSAGVPSCPAPPCRSAVLPDPTSPWYVRVLESTGNDNPVGGRPSADWSPQACGDLYEFPGQRTPRCVVSEKNIESRVAVSGNPLFLGDRVFSMGISFPRTHPILEFRLTPQVLRLPQFSTRLGESTLTLSNVRPRLKSLSFPHLRC